MHIHKSTSTAASTRAKPSSDGDAPKGEEEKKSTLTSTLTMRSELYGSDAATTDLDEEKLNEARRKQREHLRGKVETDDRKRKYNSMRADAEVTKEDVEAYRLEKRHAEDPMANFKGGEDDEFV